MKQAHAPHEICGKLALLFMGVRAGEVGSTCRRIQHLMHSA